MKKIENVKSQTRPIEIDDSSSNTTVFVRKNIKKSTEIDPIFKTERDIFIYDEYQYEFNEWNKIITDAIKNEGLIIQERVDLTQLAMSEILMIVGTMYSTSNIQIPQTFNTEPQFSAISQMYAGMLNRGLISIDSIQEPFKSEVIEYLKLKEE